MTHSFPSCLVKWSVEGLPKPALARVLTLPAFPEFWKALAGPILSSLQQMNRKNVCYQPLLCPIYPAQTLRAPGPGTQSCPGMAPPSGWLRGVTGQRQWARQSRERSRGNEAQKRVWSSGSGDRLWGLYRSRDENAVRAERGGSKCGWVGKGDPFGRSPG